MIKPRYLVNEYRRNVYNLWTISYGSYSQTYSEFSSVIHILYYEFNKCVLLGKIIQRIKLFEYVKVKTNKLVSLMLIQYQIQMSTESVEMRTISERNSYLNDERNEDIENISEHPASMKKLKMITICCSLCLVIAMAIVIIIMATSFNVTRDEKEIGKL